MSFLSGKGPKIEYTPPGFSGGGISSNFSGNSYNVSPSADRTAAVGGLSDTFANFGNETGALRSTVAPGFNQMLQSRLAQINDAGTAAIGNLQQNLSARRILGSSFGNDTVTRANLEIARQRDATIADNYLRSLDANNQLLQQQYGAYSKQYSTALDEMNLEAGIASNLTGQASTQLAANARAQAELDAKAQEAQGKFIGSMIGLAAAPFTGGASLALTGGSLFGGGGMSGNAFPSSVQGTGSFTPTYMPGYGYYNVAS